MGRETLIEELKAYSQKWPEEKATAERFSNFVSRNPDCFERNLEKGHVTGSAWIISQDQTKTLLTHHRKLGAWFQLGGHADGCEEPRVVAMNEAVEESGIQSFKSLSDEIFDIDIHLIPALKNVPEHFHYDIRFLLTPDGSDELEISHESLDLQWVKLSEIESYTSEASMLRMTRKWNQFCS